MPLFRFLAVGFAAVFVLLGSPPPLRAGSPEWPQNLGDIPADPSVTFGVLPNGMRYAIKHSETPPGLVSVRFLITAGSMQEAAGQHGLAHFLEHMAFHGSTHVPDGQVRATLERMGLRFGPDVNAMTGPQSTVYIFDLPKNDDASIDTALMLDREIAGELVLDPKLMDAERGVILNEAYARSGAGEDFNHRLRVDWIGDHPVTRPTIGAHQDIETGSVSSLRVFYNAYYRPERAILIVVGDVDAIAVKAKIAARFSDWQAHGPAGANPSPVTSAPAKPRVIVETVPGMAMSGLLLLWNQPYRNPEITRSDLEQEVALHVAESASIDRMRRLSELAGTPVGSINEPRSFGEDIPGVARLTLFDAWNITDLPVATDLLIEGERQLAAYGLTQAELDRAITRSRTELQDQIRAGSTRQTRFLANSLVESSISGEVYQSPEQRLATFEGAVRRLGLDKANALLRAELTKSQPRLLYAGPSTPTGGDAVLSAELEKATSVQVAAYTAPPAKTWSHTYFGPTGVVVERHALTDTGATFIRFENGVRLVVKPTAFAKNQFIATVRFGHGQLDLPRDRVGASDWGAALLGDGGLADLKQTEIADALVGHTVFEATAMQLGYFEMTTSTPGEAADSRDLKLQMQLFAAALSAPGWRATDWPNMIALADSAQKAADADPGLIFMRDGELLLHSGDVRWAPETPEMRASWKPSDAETFMRPIVEKAPLEVTVVGDVSVDSVIQATAVTLGALPKRARQQEPNGLTDVRFPPPTLKPVVLRHAGPPDKALVVVSWPGTDAYADTREVEAARVLADIMLSRIFDEVRVKHGWSYSPSVVADFSTTLPGYGMIIARVSCSPNDADAVLDTIDAIAAQVALGDVTADEVVRAVGPRVAAAKHAQQTNIYWLQTLAAAQRDPRALAVAEQAVNELQSLTSSDVEAAARRWLVSAKSWRMQILPKPAGA